MIANPSYKATGCGCGGGKVSAAPCGCGGEDCAACQGQSITRPRFFAGQLLTEDDLQLLTDYVGQKNRLHNRFLFGDGVVCGLEVTCHPCGDGNVIVHPGYAIDCCGNDLTLPCAQVLDINAMVRDLRRDQLGGFDCGDPCPDPETLAASTPATALQPGQETTTLTKPKLRYCLYARYYEQPSDPVMPYSTGEDCGGLACTPTRVREGVKFELRCRPQGDAANPLLERLCACLGDLNRLPAIYEAVQKLQNTSNAASMALIGREDTVQDPAAESRPTQGAGGTILPSAGFEVGIRDRVAESAASFQEVRDWLIERLSNSPFLTDCTLRDKVYAMALPPISRELNESETRSFVGATRPLIEVLVNYLRDCLCRAFNPACVPCEDTAVLLACLEIDECKVVKVCNFERTFVLSPAAVRYWLPPLQLIGNLMERLCCDPLEDLMTEEEKGGVDVGFGHLDLTGLLKREVTRILEDSSCLFTRDAIHKNITKIFESKSNDAPDSASRAPSAAPSTPSAAASPDVAKMEVPTAATVTAGMAATASQRASSNIAPKKAASKSVRRPKRKPPAGAMAPKSVETPPAARVTEEPKKVNGGNGAKTNGAKKNGTNGGKA